MRGKNTAKERKLKTAALALKHLQKRVGDGLVALQAEMEWKQEEGLLPMVVRLDNETHECEDDESKDIEKNEGENLKIEAKSRRYSRTNSTEEELVQLTTKRTAAGCQQTLSDIIEAAFKTGDVGADLVLQR